jgi:hypothetical protein
LGDVDNAESDDRGLTSSERDFIRRELDRFFSTLPSVADGFLIKIWRGSPQAGRPAALPAEGLLARALLRGSTPPSAGRDWFSPGSAWPRRRR